MKQTYIEYSRKMAQWWKKENAASIMNVWRGEILDAFKNGIFPIEDLDNHNQEIQSTEGIRIRISITKQMLQSLLIAPAWVKAGNSSPRLLHNLRQFLYSLRRSRKKCILNWLNQYRVKTTVFDQNTVKRLNEIELSNTFDGQKKILKGLGSLLFHESSSSTAHGNEFKDLIKAIKMKYWNITSNMKFELHNNSGSKADIKNYFECIIKTLK